MPGVTPPPAGLPGAVPPPLGVVPGVTPPPSGMPGVTPPPSGMPGVTPPPVAPGAMAAAAPPPLPAAPQHSGPPGLMQVGGPSPLGGIGQPAAAPPGTPTVDPLAALNSMPDASNPYLNSGRPDIDNRPVGPMADGGGGYVEPGTMDTGKIMKIGGAVAAGLLAFWVTSNIMGQMIKIAPPTDYTTYSTASGAFSIDKPTDWSQSGQDTKREDSMTGQKYEAEQDGARIWKGKALVDISTDEGLAAAQDILLSGGGPTATSPFDVESKNFIKRMKKRVGGFDKKDGASFALPGFRASVSEYTGTDGFLGIGGKVHGYAATIQGPKHIMQIFLQCPENSWEGLHPAFEKMLKSIKLDGIGAAELEQQLRDAGGEMPAGGMPGGMPPPGMPPPGMEGDPGAMNVPHPRNGNIGVPGGGEVPMPTGGGF